MTDIVTFPCKYLAFCSGYDERLIEHEEIANFEAFCAKHAVTPIFLYRPRYGSQAQVTHIPILNGNIALGEMTAQGGSRPKHRNTSAVGKKQGATEIINRILGWRL